MTIKIRNARPEDAAPLTAIINVIIAAGGNTAHQTPFTAKRFLRHYIRPKTLISCQVACLDGTPVGFQSLFWPDAEGDFMPDGWAIIASFVSEGATGQGIGQKLFRATKTAAQTAGVAVIDATIRADNVIGLRYYSRLGFVDYDVLPAVPLRDGTRVDRIRKRFDIESASPLA